jgi:protein-disulfide isomerase
MLAGCGGGGTTGNGSSSAPATTNIAPPAGQQWTDVVSATRDGFRMGNPDAPVKLIEYGSRTCPVCGQFGREGTKPLEELVKTGRLSWEFREYFVHGQPDLAPALLGRCGGPGPFFGLLEQMYVEQQPFEEKMVSPEAQALNQRMQGQPPIEVAKAWDQLMGYTEFVKQRGIPEDKARACLNDGVALKHMLDVMNDAQNNKNVNGTPTFFINDRQIEGVSSWSGLEPALRDAGA